MGDLDLKDAWRLTSNAFLNTDTGRREAIANGTALYELDSYGSGGAYFIRAVNKQELNKYKKHGTLYI